MSQFKPLANGGKMDGMITHHITAAQGVHPDDPLGARADITMATVEGQVLVPPIRRLGQDFAQPPRGSAGCIELLPVMHLDDFLVVVFAERFRRNPSQVKKEIYTHGKIRSKDECNPLRGGFNHLAFIRRVSGRANDQWLAVVRRDFREVTRKRVMGKFNQRVAAVDEIQHIIALVDTGDYFQRLIPAGQTYQRFAHPAL